MHRLAVASKCLDNRSAEPRCSEREPTACLALVGTPMKRFANFSAQALVPRLLPARLRGFTEERGLSG